LKRRTARRTAVGFVGASLAVMVTTVLQLRPADVSSIVHVSLTAEAAVTSPPSAPDRPFQVGGPTTPTVGLLRFNVEPSGVPVRGRLTVRVHTATDAGLLVAATSIAPASPDKPSDPGPALGGSGPAQAGAIISIPLGFAPQRMSGAVTLAVLSASDALVTLAGPLDADPPRLDLDIDIGPSNRPVPAVGGSATQSHVVVAAGDIACDPDQSAPHATVLLPGKRCGQVATANLATSLKPFAVLPLGDTQYETGALDSFLRSYDHSWGRLLAISHPIPGNHEYLTTGGAAGYYAYFGPSAGKLGQGWYSYDIGGWHLIALNGECDNIGGCGPGSAQERWLAEDLAAHPALCTLAYWHEPRFSSGHHGNDPTYDAFWQDLYRAGAEIVLNAHDHDYERFAPQTPKAVADPDHGIQEFIVGTGGEDLGQFNNPAANSEQRDNSTFGVLELTLSPSSYQWRFVPEPGNAYTDTGSRLCHNTPNATTSP
jgi:acid phosphatase type 7